MGQVEHGLHFELQCLLPSNALLWLLTVAAGKEEAVPLQVLLSDCALSLLFAFCCISSMWILGRLPGSNVPFLRKAPLGDQDPALPALQIP